MLSGWRRVQVIFSALQHLAGADERNNCEVKVKLQSVVRVTGHWSVVTGQGLVSVVTGH